ncbi:uncharacterized protein B0I36DRAFT_375518 [Microdochium trichocladiopsis]|uniref:NADH:flavin oxidoreductase/NADH oxidase N-terminal domain-containing protein n=1 Tax=Microdochium trichocladiopsis TaxID=1682393 RepID=A0A9P9BNK9_9PEZI|nr:uncharacterized protein B0I36DRAFT_375518 [Microdochium trichocladiopsis]KAH7027848.1 hypothetical protein B0I36DRAFT_375518 [Microdochium trichocladiopsis]
MGLPTRSNAESHDLYFIVNSGQASFPLAQANGSPSEARSRAVKAGLERKRRLERANGGNFRNCIDRKLLNGRRPQLRAASLGKKVAAAEPVPALDAFDLLAGDTEELQSWLRAPFTVADELVLNNFSKVIHQSNHDPALRSAAMLTVSFAKAGLLDRRGLEYQSRALRVIASRVQSVDAAALESTLAAILLLAGIEVSIFSPILDSSPDMPQQSFTERDLNASVMTGSARIVHHSTFEELKWRRDSASIPCSAFYLQEGFRPISHLLSSDFIEVLKDIQAFQLVRDASLFGEATNLPPAQIDNHQASIQSRLSDAVEMTGESEGSLQESLRVAAYLCCTMLRCRIWRTSGAPPYLASKLLQSLRCCLSEPTWNVYPDILTWLVFVGGAFSPAGSPLRSEFLAHMRSTQNVCIRNNGFRHKATSGWPTALSFARNYIWSERAFSVYFESFWQEIQKSTRPVMSTESRLFQPLKVGKVQIQHRIAMAPLTRKRATHDRVPTRLMKEYYGQRACVPGTLIITEGTFVSAAAGGFPHAPGIWNEDQVDAWREITDEVHRRGSFIFCQIFAMGRAADADTAEKEGVPIIAPSAIPLRDRPDVLPLAMTIDDIKQMIRDFTAAAKNAVRAGFDGVECHVANGYLLDQFLQDVSNQRTDEYGGSNENRARAVLEVLEALVDALGADRVGLRLSPWSTFQDMRMADPIPQFTHLLNQIKGRWSDLAYLHLVESRISGSEDVVGQDVHACPERLDFAYDIWEGPILVAGAYGLESARRLVDTEHSLKQIVVVFGRHFIANPDLVFRLRQGSKLNPYDRNTFYSSESPRGYTDYPYSNEFTV